jgi:hypothetical protein
VRNKLQRWKLPEPPAHIASRVLHRLELLRRLVPPRVSAAYFSALWNRWTTARRFQRRGSATNRCLLCCPQRAEDSLEHYAACSVVRKVGRDYLGLDMCENIGNTSEALQEFLMTGRMSLDTESRLLRGAVLVYATYMTTNNARPAGPLEAEVARHAMMQHAKQGVQGHAEAMRAVDNWWSAQNRRFIATPGRS